MISNLPKFLFVIAIAALSGFLMSFRFLDFFGIAPNLFLVFGLLFIYLPTTRKFNSSLAMTGSRWLALALVLIIFFSFAFTIFNFWPHYILILLGVLFFSYVIKSFLTGIFFLDYLVQILVGTFLFYFLSGAITGTSLFRPAFAVEAVYNIVVGLLSWVILTRFRIL